MLMFLWSTFQSVGVHVSAWFLHSLTPMDKLHKVRVRARIKTAKVLPCACPN